MYLVNTTTALGAQKIPVKSLFDNDDLIKKTGIEHVYKSDKGTVDLAVESCRKIDDYIDKDIIKLCIMVTQTPDDYLPANSITLSNRIKLSNSCLTLDMNQGCSGFVQAFCLLDKLIANYGTALLVTADRYRSKLNESDRSTNAVFSDGASATIFKYDPKFGIIYEDHYTDGSKRDLLFQSASEEENNGHLHMSGAEVWMFTRIKVVPQILKAVNYCKDNNLKIGGIYIHQASRVVVDGIKTLLKGYENKVHENYSKQGNTVSSSIPFLLQDFPINYDDHDSVNIFAGFGVGLTSSVIIYGRKKS